LYEDKLSGVLSEKDFMALRDEFNIELESFRHRLERIDVETERLQDRQKKAANNSVPDLIKKYQKIEKLTHVVMDEFIEKILIGEPDPLTKERGISIEWNI